MPVQLENRRDTVAAKGAERVASADREKLLADGDTLERLEVWDSSSQDWKHLVPDDSSITRDEWKQFAAAQGFDADAFVPGWVRGNHSTNWKRVTGVDRYHEIKRKGGIVIEGSTDTRDVGWIDLGLVAIPRARIDAMEEKADGRYQDFVNWSEREEDPENFDKSKVTRRAVAHQAALNRAAGIIGPTAGRSYQDVMANMTVEQIAMEAARHRSGNRHVSRTDLETQVQEQLKGARVGRTQHAIGAGFDANGQIVRS